MESAAGRNGIIRPLVETVTEASTKAPKTSTKPKPKFKPTEKMLENFRRGNKTEAEQLKEMSKEMGEELVKNKKPFTTEEGITVPDGMTKSGRTIEVKDFDYQDFTRQLRE